MIIIADSGSTKTDWALQEKDGSTLTFCSQGINPFMLSQREITEIVRTEVLGQTKGREISKVFFYGAGCTAQKRPLVTEALSEALACSSINTESDLLGAARALCGKKEGIACILGTGSNSCLYDGNEISRNVSPLGFILGDEGSGAVLGKHLIGDLLKDQFPQSLKTAFFNETEFTQDYILDRVYRQQFPNRFLASLTHFIHKHREQPSIQAFLIENFRTFFIRNIRQYSRRDLPVNFIGSVAFYFSEELKKAAEAEGLCLGKIEKAPMAGLIKFHKE